MPERVPVADSLLTSKFRGFSVKRLFQSFAIPIAPATATLLLNLPVQFYGPLGIAGCVIGGLVFVKTPACQRPHRWLLGMCKIRYTDATYHWQPTHPEATTVTYESYFHSTDEEKTRTDGGDTPDEETQVERLLGSDDTADHLDFEYIRDDGVIVTEDSVSMIIEIGPRPWLILDSDQKEAVLEAWSDILMGTQSTFQILTLPTPYDASEYTHRLEEANRTRDPDEHPLMSHGRAQHRHWIDNVVSMADIRDRQHFIVVTVRKSMAADTDEEEGGFLSRLRPAGDEEEIDHDMLAREVRSRAENMASSLPPTGVDPEIRDDPNEIKQILYYYYKGDEPPENLDHGWLTEHAPPEDVEKDGAQRPNQVNTHQPSE
ncbi:hypothetical protein ACOZ4N_00510 (plasmid) [Halorientalis pallida]|uniref:hypothetical protein n=1 Tax=Halorientalis pallida TaxID=2479928 RepID=UPI003C6EC47A